MAQNVPLDYGDPALEPFFDAIQEVLSGAAPAFRLTLLNSTTVRLLAGADDEQASLSVEGKYRHVTASINRAHPGGAAGIYDVFATAGPNLFGGVPPDVDQTDYAFDLAIVATGLTPAGPALVRKVGEIDWDGSAITSLRQLVGQQSSTDMVQATAPIPTVTPVIARGAPGQTADVFRAEESDGDSLFRVTADGSIVFIGKITGQSVDGLELSGNGGRDVLELTSTAGETGMTIGGDVELYRRLADILATPDTFEAGAYRVGATPLASTHLSDSAALARLPLPSTALSDSASLVRDTDIETIEKTYITLGRVETASIFLPFPVFLDGGEVKALTGVWAKLRVGTATFKVRKNGTDLAEFSTTNDIDVTVAGTYFDRANVAIAHADNFDIVCTTASVDAEDLSFGFDIRRTHT